MGAYAGKHKRNDNESNRERQNPDLRPSSSFKREDCKLQKIETFEQNEDQSNTTMMKAMTSQETSETEEEEISRLGLKTMRSKDTEFIEYLQKKELMASSTEKIKLRATHDFDPEHMTGNEKRELYDVLFKRGRVTKQVEDEQRHRDIQSDEEAELRASKIKGYRRFRKKKSDNKSEEAIKMEELKTVIQEKGLIMALERQWSFSEQHLREVFLQAMALPFKRGEEMDTNIRDVYIVGWLFVRHLESGKKGFIPRNRIVMDSDLKWNRILCPTKEETEETKIHSPWRLCYDDEKKQLIVGGYYEDGVNVYTLSRN